MAGFDASLSLQPAGNPLNFEVDSSTTTVR
jgi:hypothetical protein